jgi:hypothetical protein
MNPVRTKTKRGLSRRKFIRGTATAIAGFTIVPRHVLGGVGFVPPSEKVNIAIIGCGGQGRTNVRSLFEQADAQIVSGQTRAFGLLTQVFPITRVSLANGMERHCVFGVAKIEGPIFRFRVCGV